MVEHHGDGIPREHRELVVALGEPVQGLPKRGGIGDVGGIGGVHQRDVVRHRRQQGEVHLAEVVPLLLILASPSERAGRRRGHIREAIRRVIGQGGDRDPEPGHSGGRQRVFDGGQGGVDRLHGAPEGLTRKRRGGDAPRPPQLRLVVPSPDLGFASRGHHPVQRGENEIVPDGDPLGAFGPDPVDHPHEVQALGDGPEGRQGAELLHDDEPPALPAGGNVLGFAQVELSGNPGLAVDPGRFHQVPLGVALDLLLHESHGRPPVWRYGYPPRSPYPLEFLLFQFQQIRCYTAALSPTPTGPRPGTPKPSGTSLSAHPALVGTVEWSV